MTITAAPFTIDGFDAFAPAAPAAPAAPSRLGTAVLLQDDGDAEAAEAAAEGVTRPLVWLLAGDVDTERLRRLHGPRSGNRRLAVMLTGPREAVENHHRERPDAWRSALRAAVTLRALGEEGYRTALVGLITRSGMRHASEYTLLAARLGLAELWLSIAVTTPVAVDRDPAGRRSPFWAVIPRLAVAEAEVAKALRTAPAGRLTVDVGGWPACILGDADRARLPDPAAAALPLFDALWYARGHAPQPLFAPLPGDPLPVPACDGCTLSTACAGPSLVYTNALYDKEFAPIRSSAGESP